MGHAGIAITANLYTHVAPSIQKHHIENLVRLRTVQVTKEEPSGTLSYMSVMIGYPKRDTSWSNG